MPITLPVVCCTDSRFVHAQGEGEGFDGSVPWLTKIPATRTTAGRSWIPKVLFTLSHLAGRKPRPHLPLQTPGIMALCLRP